MPCLLEKKAAVNWDVCPAIEAAQTIIAKVYFRAGAKAVVTSARDGRHSRQSAHDLGNAIDLRISNLFPAMRDSNSEWYGEVLDFADGLATALQDLRIPGRNERMPGRFDVVLEASHIHLEHSTKNPPNIIGWDKDTYVYCNSAVREILDPVNPKGAA